MLTYVIACYILNIVLIWLFPWEKPKNRTDQLDCAYGLGCMWLMSPISFPLYLLVCIVMGIGLLLAPKIENYGKTTIVKYAESP